MRRRCVGGAMGEVIVMLVLLLAMLFSAGCSQCQCWYGACDELTVQSEAAEMVAANADATDEDLAEALRAVADYYAELLDNSRPFCGLYANGTYADLLRRAVAASEETARRAEAGTLAVDQQRTALLKFGQHLAQLKAATVGQQ